MVARTAAAAAVAKGACVTQAPHGPMSLWLFRCGDLRGRADGRFILTRCGPEVP